MTQQTGLLPLPEEFETVLAVVAHPDDLEYGAASAVARWTSRGIKVVYLMVTRGEAGIDSMRPEEVAPLREAEELRSAAVVGVEVVEFLPRQCTVQRIFAQRDLVKRLFVCRKGGLAVRHQVRPHG